MKNEIGARIARKRIDANLTQSELEQLSNFTHTTLSHYESGRRIPTISSVKALCKSLKCTSTDLLGF